MPVSCHRSYFKSLSCGITAVLSVLSSPAFTQNIPLVNNDTWMLKAGSSLSLPLTGTYHDFSLVKYSDYYWEFNATPRVSFLAPFIGADRIKNAVFNNNNVGFYAYGLVLKQSLARLDYEGWEGGGNSGVFYEGRGTKTWSDVVVQPRLSVTHQFGMGRSNRPVLNTLGCSAGFMVYEQTKKEFTGSFNNGAEYHQDYISRGVPGRWYIPEIKLNYTFSVVFYSGSLAIMPYAETSLLCFNNFLRFSFPDHAPLARHTEYYKEILFGVAFMRK